MLTSRTILLLPLLLTPDAAAATTYYVSNSGNASKASATTPATPMSVSTHNGSSFLPGDTIYLLATIHEKIVPPSDGDRDQVITYRGDYVGQTLNLSAGNNDSFDLDGRSYITLYNDTTRAVIEGRSDSYTIDEGGHGGELISVTNADHIVVDNWELKNAYVGLGSAANGDEAASNITLIRSYVHNMADFGVRFTNVVGEYYHDTITVGGSENNGNTFRNITKKTQRLSVAGNSHGADLKFSRASNIIASYNHFYHDVDYYGMCGVMFVSGASNALIEYNSFHGHSAVDFRSVLYAKGEGGYWDVNHVHDIILRFNNIYDTTNDEDRMYVGGPATSCSKDTYNMVYHGNRIDGTNSGLSFDIGWEYTSPVPVAYNSSTRYYRGQNVVFVPDRGAYYECIDDNGASGIVGIAPTNAQHWKWHRGPDNRDGYHLHDVYIWGNSINSNGSGISVVASSSTNTDDIENFVIANNSISAASNGATLRPGGHGLPSTSAPAVTVQNNLFYDCGRAKAHNLKSSITIANQFQAANSGNHYRGGYNHHFNKNPIDYSASPAVTYTPGMMFFICNAADGRCSNVVRRYDDTSYYGSLSSHWFGNEVFAPNPYLVDPDRGDFRLEAQSVLKDSGTDLSDITVPSITVQGIVHDFTLDTIVDPATDWTVHPPAVVTATNTDDAIGAFVYESGGVIDDDGGLTDGDDGGGVGDDDVAYADPGPGDPGGVDPDQETNGGGSSALDHSDFVTGGCTSGSTADTKPWALLLVIVVWQRRRNTTKVNRRKSSKQLV